ncbi:MAG: EAL domain-containing protein [Deltaproteobacteria bacterium]|nr:EAL domain-containing protein [Deltaproteobacteria bacterium]
MKKPATPLPKLPKPSALFATLLLITFTIDGLVHFFLPFMVPDSRKYLQSVSDSFLLATLSAPFIWWLIVRPLRKLAVTEFARTKAALGYIKDAVITFDERGGIESLNPAAERMFGCISHEMIGQDITCIIPEMEVGSSGTAFDANLRTASETIGRRKDGTCFHLNISVSKPHLGEQWTFLAIIHDITDRKRYEEQLEYQDNHDRLTTLPNRNLLTDRIHQALLIARRNRQEVALFVIDLDNFKIINDSLGHDAGDVLLKIAAERLSGCVRSGDTVARQGGDEFVVIITDQAVSDNAAHIAAKLREAIATPLRISEHELVVTCSIGISISPRDGEDVHTLLRNADVAMFRAKEQGRNAFQFYTGEMNARSLARMTMEKHLRRALEHEELLVYYQPKVNLRSGRISGMEALVRWQNPEMGMVLPSSFIPLAEETCLIEPIGEWVLRTACAQNKAWQDAGLPPLTMAVNLSPRQFRQNDIAGLFCRILQETGLDPCYLELEITESMVMHDVDRVMSILNELKGIGMYLTMDDFGTGYSSLSYLKRFPFDKLKIDQSFVHDITSDPDNAAIAKTVIAMAHSLHLRVIAEGVETQEQLNYLRHLGCDEMQGYYFSRAIPAAEFGELLREGRRLQPAPENGCGAEKTLLVVDDEKDVTASLERLFLLEGYRVLTAESAADGFDQLANNRISVVLSDLRMPVMNGNEFLSRVKGLYPDTVRIILSGYADLNSVTDAINQGAIYKFLNKPWDDDVILKTVAEAFKHHDELKGKD